MSIQILEPVPREPAGVVQSDELNDLVRSEKTIEKLVQKKKAENIA